MKKQHRKTRFWLVLTSMNIVALLFLCAPFHTESDAVRLLGALVLMVGIILLAVADMVSILFAYWDAIDEPL